MTPSLAVATVALGLAAAVTPTAGPAGPLNGAKPAGYAVEILSQTVTRTGGSLVVTGRAGAKADRTGAIASVDFVVKWASTRGFEILVDGVAIGFSELGRESRSRLLALLMPRLAEECVPLLGARLALELGRDVVGAGDSSIDLAARRGYARLFNRLLEDDVNLSATGLELALELLAAAGTALGPGAPDRGLAEELIAEGLGRSVARPRLSRLAVRLGFAPPVGIAENANAADLAPHVVKG